MKRVLSVTLAVAAALLMSAASAAEMASRPPVAHVSVSEITDHSARIAARINPEGSETSYTIWFEEGCVLPTCERAGPYEARVGVIKLRKGTAVVAVTVHGLPARTPDFETWVEATNASGTTTTSARGFKTK